MRHSKLSVARSRPGRFAPLALGAAAVGLVSAAPAAAQVPGFGNLPPTLWDVQKGDTGIPVSTIEPGKIEMTNGSQQVRSVTYRFLQDAGTFTASFTYEVGAAASACCDNPGFALFVHNDPRGSSAIATSPDLFGYYRIRNSLGMVFDVDANLFAFWGNGEPGSMLPMAPIDLDSGNPIDIVLEYDGSRLQLRATDTVSGDQFTSAMFSIGAIEDYIGATTGFVGVGAGSADWTIGHRLSNFSYSGAAPCVADLDLDGELTLFDFLAFQNLFDAGDPIADFDGDGEFTIFDFLAFQNAFDAGCP
jgi:hypothetical protein